jgi:hypothetical protein
MKKNARSTQRGHEWLRVESSRVGEVSIVCTLICAKSFWDVKAVLGPNLPLPAST